MTKEIEQLIKMVYEIPYTTQAYKVLNKMLDMLDDYVNRNHFIRAKDYFREIKDVREMTDDLASFISSDEDKLLQRKIQKKVASLAQTILDENKKIFIVHGRNIGIRDKITSLLGKLRLDYVILESEYNGGATVIEKFLRSAEQCRYAIVLFSADDVGNLSTGQSNLKPRVRQNVVLELGYFLSHVGRKNIAILHQVGFEIEKPSDFDGIVYEPFDEYGAWKSKLIKEMRKAKIYIDPHLEQGT